MPRSTIRIFPSLLLLSMFVFGASPARAQWLPGGAPLTGGSFLQGHAVVPDGQGGVATYWISGQSALMASRVLADGTPSATLPLAGAQVGVVNFFAPFVIAAPAGGDLFVAARNAFLSGQNHSMQMYRVNADGVTAPGWPDTGRRAYDSLKPIAARMEADGLGGVICAWLERREGTLTPAIAHVWEVRALRMGGNGDLAPGWPPEGVAVSVPPPAAAPTQMGDIQVVRDGTGGMFIAWQDSSDGIGDIHVQRLTGTGAVAPGWPAAGRAVCSVASRKHQLRMKSDGAGGVFVAWSEHRAPEVAAYVIRVLANGTTAPGWPASGLQISEAGTIAGLGHVAPDGSGGLILGYLEYRDGLQPDVYAKRVLASGAVAPGWSGGVAVAIGPAGDDVAGVHEDGAGGAFFLTGGAPGASTHHTGLTAFALDAGGLPSGGLPAAGLAITAETVSEAELLPAGPGAAIVKWRRGSGAADLRGFRVESGQPTPVQASVVSAIAEPGRVWLEWRVLEAGDSRAAVQRRGEREDWAHAGDAPIEGTGRVVFEDRGVAPGRWTYRLAVREAGAERFVGEVHVSVPAPYALAMRLTPNPAPSGRLSLAFTLPVSGPARIDVVDVGGRTVEARDLGVREAGPHAVTLTRALPPGVYLVALTQGERRVTRRSVVVR